MEGRSRTACPLKLEVEVTIPTKIVNVAADETIGTRRALAPRRRIAAADDARVLTPTVAIQLYALRDPNQAAILI